MKFRTIFFYLFFLCIFTISSYALAEDSYLDYLNDLHAQGQERVIVKFKGDIDPSLIELHEGNIIRTLTIINSIVCEIPKANIEPLRNEPSIAGVRADGLMRTESDVRQISSVDFKQYQKKLRGVKTDYLRQIRNTRTLARRKAQQEYLVTLRSCNAEKATLTRLRNQALASWKRAKTAKDKQFYLDEYNKYVNLLAQCNARRVQNYLSYKAKLKLVKETYQIALSSWRMEVIRMVIEEYRGPAVPEWETLEAGINAKAAWDRYGVDGEGIKVAFIDTGVNYNLPDLGAGIGPTFKCLGGYDFVDDDSDPMPYIDPVDPNLSEWHGTGVVANCMGTGDSQVVGVAYNASYYALRALGPDGYGPTSNAVAALEWCLDPDSNPATIEDRPDIVNLSIAIYDEDEVGNPFWIYDRADYEAACDAVYNAGIILVAGSGNRGYDHPGCPAAFANVIAVGGHAEDQTLFDVSGGSSNGGVDFVAPGENNTALSPENILYHASGTSGSAAFVSGLVALQMQYAQQQKMQTNHGYNWELAKHSTKAMPLITNPVYKGSGKACAADTAPIAPDKGDGAIDCIAAKWPLDFTITYDNYAYIDGNGRPAYYIGTTMYYDTMLVNNTNTAGTHTGDIENLDAIATQAYYNAHGEANLPGSPIETFPRQFVPPAALLPGGDTTLTDSYYIPWGTYAGLDRIIIDLKFEFADDTNNRAIGVTYPYASIWCPPAEINKGIGE